MSDLIDFDSPNTNNIEPVLASPLIPAPENTKNDVLNSNEAGPHFLQTSTRRSAENNPFDMVMRKIADYERNQNDPFEKVTEKAMTFSGRMSIEAKDDFILKNTRDSKVLNFKKTTDETEASFNLSNQDRDNIVYTENDTSIITDLNNTNLIDDKIYGIGCDKVKPKISICPSYTDLSILNDSAMNDSLIDQHNFNKNVNNRPRSVSQSTFLFPKIIRDNVSKKKMKRSASVNEVAKINVAEEDNSMCSVRSSMFEDPLNNAFKISLKSDSSYKQDSLKNKQEMERTNSDSSVFSNLSNTSPISFDTFIKMRQERFGSESSVISGISNVSTIPTYQTSSDSSVFTNETINNCLIGSRLQINSTTSEKNLDEANEKSNLIKKFYKIKTQMSTSPTETSNILDEKKLKEKNYSYRYPLPKLTSSPTENHDEKLVDVDSGFDSALNKYADHSDIIAREAKVLAETFEKLAFNEMTNETNEDDIFFSKSQLNFDNLPPSDDETTDNLIEFHVSPQKKELSTNESTIQETHSETLMISSKNDLKPDIKALENQFIDQTNSKKASAAVLLLELNKIVMEENNPDACKVLNDLQNLLGIECDNNTKILQVCLQNANNISQSNSSEKVSVKCEPNEKLENIYLDCKSTSSSSINRLRENQHNILNNNTQSNYNNKSLNSNKNAKVEANSQILNDTLKNHLTNEEISEDQKLAMNLIHGLNKIVSEKKGKFAINILQSLGTVLNIATESKTASKDKTNLATEKQESNIRLSRNNSVTSLQKSPSLRTQNIKSQSKSFEILPLRRSLSTNSKINVKSLLELPSDKEKRKSQLLNVKKQFSNTSEFMHPTSYKSRIYKSNSVDLQANLRTKNIENKVPAEPVKTKLKRKSNLEITTKKGPLKAIIPVGNMQKLGSINHGASTDQGHVTPPKVTDGNSELNIISSTPKTNGINQNSKLLPSASSTPNTGAPNLKHRNPQNLNVRRKSYTSPTKMNYRAKEKIKTITSTTKKLESTLSPQKRSLTPRKNYANTSDSRILKLSPRPVRVRNYSMTDLKSAKSPQSNTGKPKVSSEKIKRHSVRSPLKNSNNLSFIGQPINLVSKFGQSNNIKIDSEKENYA